MANVLDDYPQGAVTREDYVRLLRQYTHEHYLSAGHPDLQEDYDPETGRPIVGLSRSHHYSHSTYVDLILSGLVGVRPRADEVLEIAPLVPTGVGAGERPIRYFAVEGLLYHGHEMGVVWDEDGIRYGAGKGLSVFVDGRRVSGPGPMERRLIPLPRRGPMPELPAKRVDLAINPGLRDGPVATASSTATETGIAEAIDGRMWFFPENGNGWSPADAEAGATSWYAVDLREELRVGSVELYFFGEGERFRAPTAVDVQ